MTPEQLRQFAADNDSFGFEMRVCAVLNRGPVRDLQHGATYSDPVTGYNRQFDFRFTIRHERRCLLFAVECKNIDPEVPVIVCGRKRPKREAFVEVIASRTYDTGPRSTILRKTVGLYAEDGFVGKSVLKPERDAQGRIKSRSNDSEVHDRWSQAIASSHDLVRVAAMAGSSLCSIVLPVVVVPDNALWQIAYDEEGEATGAPQPVSSCALFVGHRFRIEPEGQT
jgi:hypothetical protein